MPICNTNKFIGLCAAGALALALAAGCASAPVVKEAPVPEEKPMSLQQRVDSFLESYFADLSQKELAASSAWWNASTNGSEEASKRYAEAELARRLVHADEARFAALKALRAEAAELRARGEVALDAKSERSLELAELAFKGEQLPPALLKQMVDASTEIELIFKTFRPTVGGKRLTNNDLLGVLTSEKSSKKRQEAWLASKEVGAQVAGKLIALAKVRNEAARSLGYANFWDMQMRLQEHDPAQVIALFAELERVTDAPFAAMKAQLDAEVGRHLKVAPKALMPWHYTNPFFQDAPPNEKVNLDTFFAGMPQERIAELAVRFYADIGIDAAPIIERSDLYEREGKDQHAFCITLDRKKDIRTLQNVKATNQWMETMLHEVGHGVYYAGIDESLPFNLREAAHTLTTEATAMLFGALAKNPMWLTSYAGIDAKAMAKVEKYILEQRRREQLIFVRWGLVMLNFERALYENPDQDLDALWYQYVARFQGLKPLEGRHGDWAAKPHFTVAPVYYHNYVMAELMAAQLRSRFATMAGHTGPASALSFNGRKEFGQHMNEKLFAPGMSHHWPELVEEVTGAKLSTAAFEAEVK